MPGTKAALLLLSALSLPSLAQGPDQITVTALPYVLTNTGAVIVNTNYPVKPIPKAVGISTFASLFGGGFSAALPSSSAAAGGVAAMFAVKKLTIVRDQVADQKWVNNMEGDAETAINKARESVDSCFDENANVVRFNGTKASRTPNPTNGRRVSNRIMALRMRNALPKLAAADTCELPEEEEAEQAEEEVEALNESQAASEEALEAAEDAAEAAEVAAEAAEAAAEGALEGIEILETILEACSLF